MGGTILENLSGKKLACLVSALIVIQFVCFLIGGLIGENFYFCLLSICLHSNKQISGSV